VLGLAVGIFKLKNSVAKGAEISAKKGAKQIWWGWENLGLDIFQIYQKGRKDAELFWS
jgi:hypothetical protein